jgi:transcriptional regulator with XRE-family HTH domain
VDDQRLGAGLRAVRIRRGWRQRDLAAASSVSDATVSRIERGHLDGVQVRTLRDVARALDIRIELLARSRGGDLDRLINAKHAALSEAVVAWLRSLPGWTVRPEVSYAWFGERGVVDLLAWSEERSALLEVELKTAIVDTGELLATIDRRRRLGREIAEPLGWAPSSVSSLLVIAESAANRTRVRVLSSTFDAALPDRIPEVRHYLRQPAAALRGLIFFSNRRPGQAINAFATARRVRAVSGRAPVAHSTPGDGLNEESPNSVLR